MAQKLYDLVVKTGEYQVNGETKARYENIGSVMQGDNGQFAIIKRTFNPAGVPNPDGKDSIIVSMFEPKSNQQQQGNFNQQQQQSQQLQQQNNTGFAPQQNNGGFAPQQNNGGFAPNNNQSF